MGYAKDPMSYTNAERKIMLGALGKELKIRCSDKKEAFNLRGRLYGLRAATAKAYEKLQTLEKQGKDTRGYDDEFVRAAPAIRELGVRVEGDEKSILVIGRGSGISQSLTNTLDAALANAGIETQDDEAERQMQEMLDRLKDVKTEKEADSLADLGYTTTQPQEKTDK